VSLLEKQYDKYVVLSSRKATKMCLNAIELNGGQKTKSSRDESFAKGDKATAGF
jgi:hypothetical protein